MEKKALIIVDMLNDFLSEKGALFCGETAREIIRLGIEAFKHAFADRDTQQLAGGLALVALADLLVFTEQHHTDLVLLEGMVTNATAISGPFGRTMATRSLRPTPKRLSAATVIPIWCANSGYRIGVRPGARSAACCGFVFTPVAAAIRSHSSAKADLTRSPSSG